MSYGHAVQYAIKQAKKMGKLAQDAHWHPHQLRHTFGTEIRKVHGLDAARALMGHRSLSQAEEYAELDAGLAAKVAAAVG
jgi:integrase